MGLAADSTTFQDISSTLADPALSAQRPSTMTQSYSQIVKQIQSLQRKADAARKKEVSGVVGRIREAIAYYKLTAGELGLGPGKSVKAAPAAKAAKRKPRKSGPAKSKSASAAKYRDEAGNIWVGRGPRPAWLRAALESGKSLQDFAIASPAKAAAVVKVRRRSKARRAKKASVAKYSDGAGRTWTGRGRKPQWFIDALAQGKAAESMAI
jgi:DNA-binding protein H-NS